MPVLKELPKDHPISPPDWTEADMLLCVDCAEFSERVTVTRVLAWGTPRGCVHPDSLRRPTKTGKAKRFPNVECDDDEEILACMRCDAAFVCNGEEKDYPEEDEEQDLDDYDKPPSPKITKTDKLPKPKSNINKKQKKHKKEKRKKKQSV